MNPRKDSTDLDILTNFTLKIIQTVTGITANNVLADTLFSEIGIDSLAVMNFNAHIAPHFPELSKTLLFDCRSAKEVASHLLNHQSEAAKKLIAAHKPEQSPAASEEPLSMDGEWPILAPLPASSTEPVSVCNDIAIIGLQGRFPGAKSTNAFWNNLLNGVDSVREIPSDRWPLDGFFEAGALSRDSGRSYAKWGGFLDDIDKFDAQFFGISPREAAIMDPQERIFLECAWHAMEDGALLGERSASLRQDNGALDIGVFVGVTTNTYPLLGPERWQEGISEIPSGMPWSVANRVSYALNLCGPSLAIDTACSSSLVALHMAVESLRKKECGAAIVGGVNLYTHPAKYLQLCQQQMLSPTGRCHSFGKDADGFVPGEGVGAAVLKPLSAALRDGDRVLAVLKGSAINHGGRTNGYTVPSPASQAKLISHVLSDTDIDPTSISYIEAHGTGTRLGDPIELEGLKQALAGTDRPSRCGVGSVKANIGHLEAAAGIASLIKVVLQLQHRRIAPSIHSRDLNPELGIEGTGFFIPQVPSDWSTEAGPLRAGISSFGAGGANAHVIIEEGGPSDDRTSSAGPLVFPLSARSRAQLQATVGALRAYVTEQQTALRQPQRFSRLAYTLQCGRSPFEHRFVAVATDIEGLTLSLDSFLQAPRRENRHWLSGRVNMPSETTGDIAAINPNPGALAALWVEGKPIVWSDFWEQPPLPDSAPLYCFARERHWVSATTRTSDTEVVTNRVVNRQEFFLRDHVIKDMPVLPAAAYIDFCRAEAERHELPGQFELRNLTWATPISLAQDIRERSIDCRCLQQNEDLILAFSSGPRTESTTHFRSICRPLTATAVDPRHDSIDAIRTRCSTAAGTENFYSTFDSLGIHYGPSFRCLKAAWLGRNEAFTELRMCPEGRNGKPLSPLDPAMLDGVLQSAFFASQATGEQIRSAFIPYSGKSLRILAPLPEHAYVHAQHRSSQASDLEVFDFTVFSPAGEIILEIEDFAFRRYETVPEQQRVHLLEPVWEYAALPDDTAKQEVGPLMIFDDSPRLFEYLRHDYSADTWLMLERGGFQYRDGRIIEGDTLDPDHFWLLHRLLVSQNAQPETLIINLTEVSAEPSKPSWERLIGLQGVARASAILRSLCKALTNPRLHVYLLVPPAPTAAVSGLLRSLNLETPTITATVIEVDPAELTGDDAEDLYSALSREITYGPRSGVVQLRLTACNREQRRLRFIDGENTAMDICRLKAGDVVIITGGLGAMGRLFSQTLARQGGLRLALVGRSPRSPETDRFLKSLQALGAEAAEYWSADCSDLSAAADLAASVREHFGPVGGIVHCAGILRDDFFIRQQEEGWEAVLQSKAMSALALDEATASDPIKVFILCSSLAGIHGNIGQSAYSLANAWLDRFAEERQELSRSGRRQGHAISVAWPLWQTRDGMQAPDYVTGWLSQNGLSLLPENEGVDIFVSALSSSQTVLVPVRGEYGSVAHLLGVVQEPAVTPPLGTAPALETDVVDELLAFLVGHLAAVTNTPIAKIDPDAVLEVFGLDSILVMELNTRLEKHFPELSKTALFEVRSLRGLANLLISEHAEDVSKVVTARPVATAPAPALPEKAPRATGDKSVERKSSGLPPSNGMDGEESGDIAIIGLAGRYPGSSNLAEFWQHLAAGHDLVTEIPDRWQPAQGRNELYARWGAFVDDFDKFDPLFFGISPRDAERMDPQERLFLQSAWHAVEDAGYTPDTLSGLRNGQASRRRVGVIAGVMYGEYQFFGAKAWPQRPRVLTNSSYASIANRVSFCLDLDGPSFAVDSMCSSSLTSIHLACGLLRSGDCELALAGGVNLSVHPYKYRMLCDLKFASSEGKCRSFGDGGNGYVPGEGVGVVLLKPLKNALQDGDYVYAVIRGSDLNHGGRTSGYTVPNADAQAQVIGRALNRANVSPERLGYVEAHGTGTSLGDPIEVRGLGKAIAERVPSDWTCPIGSVKSNIGHLESAAGMAALTKVLLQFKHHSLAPSIHAETLNQNIDFSTTPFFVQREPAEWLPRSDSQGRSLPRLAAISSFGAGGSNAHLIVEEFVPKDTDTAPTGTQPFVFSAYSEDQLRAYIRRFIAFLDRELNESGSASPALLGRRRFTTFDVAKTLVTGRRTLDCRMALVAGDFSELRERLIRWLDSTEEAADADKERIASPVSDNAPAPDSSEGVAQAWLCGQSIDLPAPAGHSWRRVPLPGYEFLRRRYWVAEEPLSEPPKPISSTEIAAVEESQSEPPLTPRAILDLVTRQELSEEDARTLLLAMT